MSRWGRLSELVRIGCLLMLVGNGLVASLKYEDSSWKYLVYLFPANLGQGMSYPAILFTFLAAFDHDREYFPSKQGGRAYPLQSKPFRPQWYTSSALWAPSGVLRHHLR